MGMTVLLVMYFIIILYGIRTGSGASLCWSLSDSGSGLLCVPNALYADLTHCGYYYSCSADGRTASRYQCPGQKRFGLRQGKCMKASLAECATPELCSALHSSPTTSTTTRSHASETTEADFNKGTIKATVDTTTTPLIVTTASYSRTTILIDGELTSSQPPTLTDDTSPENALREEDTTQFDSTRLPDKSTPESQPMDNVTEIDTTVVPSASDTGLGINTVTFEIQSVVVGCVVGAVVTLILSLVIRMIIYYTKSKHADDGAETKRSTLSMSNPEYGIRGSTAYDQIGVNLYDHIQDTHSSVCEEVSSVAQGNEIYEEIPYYNEISQYEPVGFVPEIGDKSRPKTPNRSSASDYDNLQRDLPQLVVHPKPSAPAMAQIPVLRNLERVRDSRQNNINISSTKKDENLKGNTENTYDAMIY